MMKGNYSYERHGSQHFNINSYGSRINSKNNNNNNNKTDKYDYSYYNGKTNYGYYREGNYYFNDEVSYKIKNRMNKYEYSYDNYGEYRYSKNNNSKNGNEKKYYHYYKDKYNKNNLNTNTHFEKINSDNNMSNKQNKSTENNSTKINELINNIYYKISYYLKKNRKYLNKILQQNYEINIYLIRHMEAQHNKQHVEDLDTPRDLIYKRPIYLDSVATEEGIKMCEDVRNYHLNGTGKSGCNKMHDIYYKEIIQLYNDYIEKCDKEQQTSKENSKESRKESSKENKKENKKGVFERNNNFVIISSPLRRCLQTMKYLFNFKKNIVIYEPIREISGSYITDQRSKTSEVKKFCDNNFDEYELMCFGEEDIMSVERFRESSCQVYFRCLQFLKFVHSLAINYFASIERENDSMSLDVKIGNSKSPKGNSNQSNMKNNEEKQNSTPNSEIDDYINDKCNNEETCTKTNEKNKKSFNIVVVSHSSYLLHLLALLDYLNLDARNFNNCDIRKITIPLTNTFLFFNNIINLQLAKPVISNNMPLCFRDKQKNVLKKTYKDKNIYTLNSINDIDDIICESPCTIIIYQYNELIKNQNNYKKYLEKIKNFIDNNNKEFQLKNGYFSNGMYKKYVLKKGKNDDNSENNMYNLGRDILVTDASEHLGFSERKQAWELNRKGYIAGQNVILIVLPDVENAPKKTNAPNNKGIETDLDTKTNDDDNEDLGSLKNVTKIIDNYDSVQDLIKSPDFWISIKKNIDNINLNSFHEYIIKKYNKILTTENEDFCYIDLVASLENKNFINKYGNMFNGYFKKLKEKYNNNNSSLNLEKECKYINENLINKIFPQEYETSKDEDETGEVSMNSNLTSQRNTLNNHDKINIVKKKFIYIPNKYNDKNKMTKQKNNDNYNISNSIVPNNKAFVMENIKVLKSFPQSIQNLNVEMFYRDKFFYFNCLHKFIKSKNKIEGLVLAKLLAFLDLLKAFNFNSTSKIFQKLTKLDDIIYTNTIEDSSQIVNTYSCDKKPVPVNNTFYFSASAKKYKDIQTLKGRKKGIVDDLNYIRYNMLTISGGAENVYILNVLS
ncbi:phosphoglycerate mutase, putative [Plasmodium berghei]|uniref:Phosphoglycerate mutase, putative n=3 Tax=Plasmodium berghei TaxID=5821 RepID=A0A509AGA8_PLABA|nr:phosphoglycerate mutase, putative [Plasmodium berghei ANKA]SCM15543.1 phosphoglycerate mutase, putative [Plasmodium berghei]VUC54308.1 phosphoglycerate mutase, putative [Plasmodium berghei ANKA]|eukprot:XP_034420141.1 phosphoglycerate mutase, putative [Plasmodium berghei ANKA]